MAVTITVPRDPYTTWGELRREFPAWTSWATSWSLNTGQPVRVPGVRAVVTVPQRSTATVVVVPD